MNSRFSSRCCSLPSCSPRWHGGSARRIRRFSRPAAPCWRSSPACRRSPSTQPRAGAVHRAGAAGRRLRRLARAICATTGAPSPAWSSSASASPRSPWPSSRGRWCPGCVGPGGRPRRDRLAAGCGGGDRGAAPAQAAAAAHDDPRRREPAQRRQRAADLPAGDRRGDRRRVLVAGVAPTFGWRSPGAWSPARRWAG